MKFNKLIAASITVLLMSFNITANAASYSYNGEISIVSPLQVSEQEKLNFATIRKPTIPVLVHVTPEGAVGAANTATFEDATDMAAGAFNIQGSDNNSISISASDAGGVAGIQYVGIEAKYNDGSVIDLLTGVAGLGAPGSGGAELKLGAVLNVSQTVAEGRHTPDFELDVNYE